MAEVRKVLGQADLPATTLTNVYTVPIGKQVVNSSIFICNRSGVNRTFRISVAINGEADSGKQYLYYDESVPKNKSFVFTTGLTLNEGDVVRAYASAINVSVNIFGVEID